LLICAILLSNDATLTRPDYPPHETDIVNTYRAWLRYELFRGRLTESEHQASERNLADFIAARALKAAGTGLRSSSSSIA